MSQTKRDENVARLTAEAGPYRDALARLLAAGRAETASGLKVAASVLYYDRAIEAARTAPEIDRRPGWVARARKARMAAQVTS